MADQTIQLTITDAALKETRTLLAIAHISGNQSPLAEPMAKILLAIEQGRDSARLTLAGEE